ncbi:hypothetical protein ACSSS7_004197 [Eimeria intestinalis]
MHFYLVDPAATITERKEPLGNPEGQLSQAMKTLSLRQRSHQAAAASSPHSSSGKGSSGVKGATLFFNAVQEGVLQQVSALPPAAITAVAVLGQRDKASACSSSSYGHSLKRDSRHQQRCSLSSGIGSGLLCFALTGWRAALTSRKRGGCVEGLDSNTKSLYNLQQAQGVSGGRWPAARTRS